MAGGKLKVHLRGQDPTLRLALTGKHDEEMGWWGEQWGSDIFPRDSLGRRKKGNHGTKSARGEYPEKNLRRPIRLQSTSGKADLRKEEIRRRRVAIKGVQRDNNTEV